MACGSSRQRTDDDFGDGLSKALGRKREEESSFCASTSLREPPSFVPLRLRSGHASYESKCSRAKRRRSFDPLHAFKIGFHLLAWLRPRRLILIVDSHSPNAVRQRLRPATRPKPKVTNTPQKADEVAKLYQLNGLSPLQADSGNSL